MIRLIRSNSFFVAVAALPVLAGVLTAAAQNAFVCQYDGMNETNRVADRKSVV